MTAHNRTEDGITTLEMAFAIIDAETGTTIERPWIGTGQDKGDKGADKAYTGAVKYFLMKTFMIPTGDDPENDTKETRRPGRPAKTESSDPLQAVRLPSENVAQASQNGAGGDDQLAKDVEDSLGTGVPDTDTYCKLHDKEMKRREVYGGDGFYYDHRKEEPKDSGNWFACDGTGWRAQKKRQQAG